MHQNSVSSHPKFWMLGNVGISEFGDRVELHQREPILPVVLFATGFPAAFSLALNRLGAPEFMVWMFGIFLFLMGAASVGLNLYWNSQEPIVTFHPPSGALTIPRHGKTIPASELARFALVSDSWKEAGEFFQAMHLVLDDGALVLYTSLRPKRIDQAWTRFCRCVAKSVPETTA